MAAIQNSKNSSKTSGLATLLACRVNKKYFQKTVTDESMTMRIRFPKGRKKNGVAGLEAKEDDSTNSCSCRSARSHNRDFAKDYWCVVH